MVSVSAPLRLSTIWPWTGFQGTGTTRLPSAPQTRTSDWTRTAQSLYGKLEQAVAPLFYANRPVFIEVMRHAIALNGSFFNTQRMMQQYVLKAYFV